MTATNEHAHSDHERLLRPGSGFSAQAFARPGLILWTGVALLVALGWTYLLLMVLEASPRTDMGDAGFGMSVFNLLSDWSALSAFAGEAWRAICGPGQAVYEAGVWTLSDIGLVLAMWLAMTLAMMVPTAAPMIATYADIALTARGKDMPVVPPRVLLAGYLAAWIGFCLAATAAQWGLTSASLLTPQLTLTHPGVAAAILFAAGAYQFTALKQACLVKCRTPLPFFLANWTDRTAGVFRLGLHQGLYCVACCWALMAVMFATGLMNVIWMAGLAVVMALEKTLVNPRPLVRGTGAALIGFAVALLASAAP